MTDYTPKDSLGIPINVGDHVIFSARSTRRLYIGRVTLAHCKDGNDKIKVNFRNVSGNLVNSEIRPRDTIHTSDSCALTMQTMSNGKLPKVGILKSRTR